ncbi:helix-turn-helix domain-containing protein [Leptothoe sp. PORK10 BA2]|uniref:helix-turn-helix domain-containing protein n=1 Tax=Leptothoe sp. PORK10 BA2 TaxID=3110254 RepID=UPI002B1F9DC5|nr:helix-turn-helix transcriptional regulator [Leptothoe sp. PORK10 BA2]MEA5466867.1 helix-turn-helix transcriptional regulator [Leptothoe sp. PORK10 BA2]
MSQRSLQLSESGQREARQALVRNSLTQKALAEERHIASWSTINKFFNGKPVDRIIFQEICQALGLEWEDVVRKDEGGAGSSFRLSPSSFPPPSLLTAIQTNAAAAREALTPRILERIPRSVVRKKYLPAIARSLAGQQRIIPIIAPAGCGKSTILGDLYDELIQTDTAWVGLVLCSTLSLSTAYMSFMSYGFVAGTFATQTAYNPNQPSQLRQSMIDNAFGNGLCGQSRGIVDTVADLTQHHGRGVLLIDTLDLVDLLHNSFYGRFLGFGSLLYT